MTVQPVERPGGLRLLQASGELDARVVPDLLATVPGLVVGARGVVLDLTGVSFLDSSGVRLVDRLARECGQASTGFRVVAPPGGRARRVLELVGLPSPPLTDDLPAALVQAGSAEDAGPGSAPSPD